jgi:Bacterial aa3 type cytochrome c oxidase subunit IV
VVTAICECGIQAGTICEWDMRDMAEYKHGEMDITVQTETFDGFISFVKRTVMVILAVVVFMAIFTT